MARNAWSLVAWWFLFLGAAGRLGRCDTAQVAVQAQPQPSSGSGGGGGGGAMAGKVLHGSLDGAILEATLSSGDEGSGAGSKVKRFFKGVGKGHITGKQKLYATVDLGKARVFRTRVVDDDTGHPQWNESFHIYCAHATPEVVFTVKDRLPVDAKLIGRAYLPVQDLLKANGKAVDRWLDILDEARMPLENQNKIHVQVAFTDVAADPRWGGGVGGAQYPGVPRTFFKQWPGSRVTLYQDAHVLDTFQPKIQLAGGRPYEPRRCWEDVYDAINDAKHLVYITGWSVNAEITLVRDATRRHPGVGVTLGDLLKRKAGEGVRVFMLVWDDPTSVFNLGLNAGLGTSDANTFKYFKNTGVVCVPCPRDPDDAASFAQSLKTLAYSHHQKSVIVDVKDGSGGLRRIASFVGGIDLTNDRYDTQEHSLFRTLNTVHSNDFYQKNLPGASLADGGPREPWQDIHCKIEGPAAWDVLRNFEQRWRKQGGKDALLDLKAMEKVIAPQSSPVVPAGDQEAWNVQVFRSADSSACDGLPEAPAEMAQSGLVNGNDHVIERSIQDAYIQAIRRAKRFIYIENQYFLGSSFAWKPDGGVTPEYIEALQLIPMELTLKIVSKIEAGEPFAVYVVVPMWPEGDPNSWSVQAILHWQRKTMEMMYSDVAAALKAKNIVADPKDYLSFFCLGNREVKLAAPPEYEPKGHPKPGSDYDRAQKARRTMIYVHSKLMIVDDEYIIIGSANINQRSMDGGRDTEIAMGAYQPLHLNAKGQVAKGQVHGFRMSLWYEHLAELKPEFQDPGSLKCIRLVNEMASQFWQAYAGDKVVDLHGHLLTYPVQVAKDGTVTVLKGMEFFPDTNSQVFGSVSKKESAGNFILTT